MGTRFQGLLGFKAFKKGFTLIELMIVVVILGILVLIVVAYFRSQIFKGNDAKRKSDINRIKIAVEEYEKDHSCYPLPQYVSCNPGTALQPYIDKVPCDPKTGTSYFYDYQDSTCPQWYRFFALLENTNDTQATPGIGPFGAYNFVSYSTNAPLVSPSGGSSTPPPSGNPSGFYGCISGVCTPIAWDPKIPGPVCSPNYLSSTCYSQCGSPQMNVL